MPRTTGTTLSPSGEKTVKVSITILPEDHAYLLEQFASITRALRELTADHRRRNKKGTKHNG